MLPYRCPSPLLALRSNRSGKRALMLMPGMAKLSLISDDGLVRLTNTLAEVTDATVLRQMGSSPGLPLP